jgi:hypothetical protein
MSAYLMTGEFRDFVIDIGEDGGKLTITQSVPPVYLINGGVVNEAAAYAWIRHWHALRDAATPVDPPFSCLCEPCQKTRELHR